jgi:YD repeat-containing protein
LRNATQHTADALGRLTRIVEPGNLTTNYSYDALSNLLSISQLGNSSSDTPRTRTFTYDSLSRLIQSYNPETGWICYGQWSGGNCVNGYDPNGNLLFKTDARGVTTNYTYDNLNRLVAKTYSPNAPAGSLSSCYAFDTATNGIGRLAAEWTKAGSCTTTSGYQTMRQYLAYDSMGRLWNEQQCVLGHCTSGPTPPCAASGNIAPYYQTYCYDLAGNMTWNVNGVSNVPNVPGANTIGFSYTYDAAGRLSTLGSTWSDGLHPSPLFTADPTSGYSPAGALQNLTLGNSISVIKTYDNRLRATGETAKQQ